jgi:hypothetical protein
MDFRPAAGALSILEAAQDEIARLNGMITRRSALWLFVWKEETL